MDPSRLPRGPQGFFWLFGPGVTPNERREDVAIVHVRGPLEHHDDSWGSDSYESILSRVGDAMSGADAARAYTAQQHEHGWRHQHEDDYEPLPDRERTPPAAVLLCLDSPGGVVSGLNETVKALRKIARESKVKLVAYVNEMAASAAYALTCACSEVLAPPSAIIGSIGVISTMISQAAKDRADGFDVRLIMSGARKADGHPHVPITKDALAAERDRVDKLAASFFQIASKARGLSVARIQGYEAAIYLGRDAKKRGLVDSVCSLDDAILGLSKVRPGPTEKAAGNEMDRRARQSSLDIRGGSGSPTPKAVTNNVTRHEVPMAVALAALIKKTEAALREERDPERYSALAMKLATYMAAAKDADDCDDEDDDDDEKKKDAKKEAAKQAGNAAKKAEEAKQAEEAAKKAKKAAAEDEADSAKALLALVESTTGERGARALGALQAILTNSQATAQAVATMQAERADDRRATLIRENAGKFLTRNDCAWLATQPLATVEGFVAHRQKAGVIVNIDDSTTIKPKAAQPGTEESLPADVLAMISAAVENACPNGVKPADFRATLVSAHLKAHTERLNGAHNPNGRV